MSVGGRGRVCLLISDIELVNLLTDNILIHTGTYML